MDRTAYICTLNGYDFVSFFFIPRDMCFVCVSCSLARITGKEYSVVCGLCRCLIAGGADRFSHMDGRARGEVERVIASLCSILLVCCV